MKIQIHDMGGQPTELTKFPQFIQQWVAQDRDGYRNYVLFVASMSDFNVPDDEKTDTKLEDQREGQDEHTKLERSIRILELLLCEATVQSCGLLIFFNKQDRFDEVVTTLQRTENGRREIEKALGDVMSQSDRARLISGNCPLEVLHDALMKKYDVVIKKRRGKSSDRGVYMRFTQAVDPDIMSDIFKVVKHEIISDFIRNGTFITL
ncbi:hypothetical protein OESDEN_00688 [Oesophagostomum dentatum]|uniref:G-protein alpha subunit n=1 Tax=Oesophagostomum dentatum TaxID=61180 RepID=A0A0B1TP29_OESDE|nr:hypothetical protein OESDEN_00688 [Oesophagostomum dentatum]